MGIFLSSFKYTIEFIKGVDNLVADSLSRLILETKNIYHNNKNSDVVNWVIKHLLIDFLQIRTKTAKDSVLNKNCYLCFRYLASCYNR
jgi:hypothetical protein